MKKINEAIAEYAKEKDERKRAYIELVTGLQKDIDRGYAGAVLAKKTIDERRLRSENTDAWKQKELLEALEKTVEDEKTKLGAVTQITADDLAELTLLEDIELTEKDLTYYISKYQNKPLAIKKLKQIYQADLRTFLFPKSKEEILNDWESQAKEAIRYITQLDYTRTTEIDFMGDKISTDMHNTFLEEALTAYNNY
ncbi:MAG: hypothetical protein E7156_07205 [Streptococcus gallolyticus]|jgi:hypothetical protein|uniref:Uncharacterized protein n=1 Tax=Streptococcus gallolyticus TaxID=315405 RepID=A0A927XIS9_9STRE|nr:hypothetical protein [Streptococcus gallolyticus]